MADSDKYNKGAAAAVVAIPAAGAATQYGAKHVASQHDKIKDKALEKFQAAKNKGQQKQLADVAAGADDVAKKAHSVSKVGKAVKVGGLAGGAAGIAAGGAAHYVRSRRNQAESVARPQRSRNGY